MKGPWHRESDSALVTVHHAPQTAAAEELQRAGLRGMRLPFPNGDTPCCILGGPEASDLPQQAPVGARPTKYSLQEESLIMRRGDPSTRPPRRG
ncbi:hypothetical protein NDU88_002772 [Pleurodeles waltl]|uniref:Uncharacterized protein n=1 Tax=Pleurodeles waltl TaxID=8319 RepID=A0AAV7SF21_PLEWA|nr:hypothetical protein NDU88_002772 [Pleurodeles waltl]